MASTLYTKVVADAERKGIVLGRQRKSINWLRDRAQEISPSKVTVGKMLSMRPKDELRHQVRVGDMMMFAYDPKWKKELPYYDIFPLIFPVKKVKGGFHGINLHYLPYRHRALLMDALMRTQLNNTNFDETTRMRINYDILKSASKFKYFEPCFKHYLDKHVQSRFIWIPPTEWQFALFLPTERFKKQTKEQVWAESKKIYRGK